MTSTQNTATSEHAELLEALTRYRQFLRYTVRDLTDEQAAQRSTVSELCLGGLIKHLTSVEQTWSGFIAEGPSAVGDWDQADAGDRPAEFRMQEGETLAGLLDAYEQAARRTDEIVRAVPDLGMSHPLPQAPWFKPGARWSARQALLHLMAETTQHAGHADIIRESLDGAKTMG